MIGLGATSLAVHIFDRTLIRGPEGNEESFWRDAEGYEPTPDECLRES